MSKKIKFDASKDYYKILQYPADVKKTDAEIASDYEAFKNGLESVKETLNNEKKEASRKKDFSKLEEIEESFRELQEKEEAYEVLTKCRKDYDDARKQYLANKHKIDISKEEFDVNTDYYTALAVSTDATKDEILEAYNKQCERINQSSKTDDEKASELAALNIAFNVLHDGKSRKEYDKARAAKAKAEAKASRKKVKNVDDGEEAKKASKKGKGIIIALATAAVVAICLQVGWCIGSKNKDTDKSNTNNPGYEQMVGGTEDNTPDADDNSQTETPEDEVEAKVNYYGDATNDTLVTERATLLTEQFNNNGIININTGAPYTVEEIKQVVLYMNGAYVPETEAEAYAMVDNYLNFVIALGNSKHVIYQVNYLGGEDSFLPELEEMNANFKPLCLVDNVLFGDCTSYPYLKWFEENYNTMICTTDRAECNRIFEMLTQSIVELTYGEGYELNGVVYTMNDFTGLDKVNSGSLFQLFVSNYQVFATYMAKDTYTFNNTLLGLDSETNVGSYGRHETMEFYNALCDFESLKDGITVDDNGLIVLVDPDNESATFSRVFQINLINNALSNHYAQDQTYYSEVYQQSLSKSN